MRQSPPVTIQSAPRAGRSKLSSKRAPRGGDGVFDGAEPVGRATTGGAAVFGCWAAGLAAFAPASLDDDAGPFGTHAAAKTRSPPTQSSRIASFYHIAGSGLRSKVRMGHASHSGPDPPARLEVPRRFYGDSHPQLRGHAGPLARRGVVSHARSGRERRAPQRDDGQLLRVHRALGGDHVARPLLP